ncbi:1992_t:CDS:1, partial [Racocetra persica]
HLKIDQRSKPERMEVRHVVIGKKEKRKYLECGIRVSKQVKKTVKDNERTITIGKLVKVNRVSESIGLHLNQMDIEYAKKEKAYLETFEGKNTR